MIVRFSGGWRQAFYFLYNPEYGSTRRMSSDNLKYLTSGCPKTMSHIKALLVGCNHKDPKQNKTRKIFHRDTKKKRKKNLVHVVLTAFPAAAQQVVGISRADCWSTLCLVWGDNASPTLWSLTPTEHHPLPCEVHSPPAKQSAASPPLARSPAPFLPL